MVGAAEVVGGGGGAGGAGDLPAVSVVSGLARCEMDALLLGRTRVSVGSFICCEFTSEFVYGKRKSVFTQYKSQSYFEIVFIVGMVQWRFLHGKNFA